MNPRLKSQPTDPLEAMRVARFMEDAEHGRWQLRHFRRTQAEVDMETARVYANHPQDTIDLRMARIVPEGEWVTLRRRMNAEEKRWAYEEQLGDPAVLADLKGVTEEQEIDRAVPPTHAWLPVMSDTPAELAGHLHPIDNAEGRVLITGLGLGCLIAGLLVKPGVERIDVVDIDPDVIELTAHYYLDDPRVHLHVGSAANPATVPSDLRWDYAWHDIWSHIADRNLKDETAEHGISYHRLFSLYADRCTEQHAWAFDEALEMEARSAEQRRGEQEFLERLKAEEDEEERVRMLFDRVLLAKQPVMARISERINDQVRTMYDPEGKFRAHIRSRLHADDFWEDMERIANGTAEVDSLGHPNAHLETA